MKYYKIFDTKDDMPSTIFHGVNGSKKLPLDVWITAVEKEVDDGGTKYISGFHIAKKQDELIKYLNRFKNVDGKCICKVKIKKLRKKKHSRDPIYLCRNIFIDKSDWKKRWKK